MRCEGREDANIDGDREQLRFIQEITPETNER